MNERIKNFILRTRGVEGVVSDKSLYGYRWAFYYNGLNESVVKIPVFYFNIQDRLRIRHEGLIDADPLLADLKKDERVWARFAFFSKSYEVNPVSCIYPICPWIASIEKLD